MSPRPTAMREEKADLNVYGHNQPSGKVVPRRGIREVGLAETLAEDRHRGESSGNRVVNPNNGNEVHALDEHSDLDDTPMPPRNAPLSDEVPS